MEKRSPVWHALSVLLLLSLIAPSFITFPGASAKVAFPDTVGSMPTASMADIGPSLQTVSGQVETDPAVISGQLKMEPLNSLPYPSVIKRLPFNGGFPITQGPQQAHCKARGLSHYPGSGNANERAIDFGMPNRTPIYAAGDGTIRWSNWEYGMIIVRIEHAGGYVSWYVHLSQSLHEPGDRVSTGQLIGYSGDTGSPGAYHLHFAVTKGNSYSSPSVDIRGIPGLAWTPGIQWNSAGYSNCDAPAVNGKNDGWATGSQPPAPTPTPTPRPTPKPSPTPVPTPPPPSVRGTLRLTPNTGPSGQYTAVYGTGFKGGETVEIRWGSVNGTVIGRIKVRSDGTYLGRITTRPGSAGSTQVFAVGLSSNYRTSAWYQITSSAPTMVLRSNRSQTPAGTTITLTGSGYQPNESVQIRWVSQKGLILGTVRANGSGVITANITIPQVPNKNYQIFATGLSSNRYGSVVHQVRTYVLSGRTLVSPNFGQSGTVVTVTGSGYQPGERVELRWGSLGGPVIGVVTANGSGSFSGRVTTRTANPGTTYIVGVGTSSYRYSSGTYTITSAARSGQLNVSHVNVRPGYVIMTNGTGWTPGQQLELRWGGSNGQLLGRVQVRANGTWSGRVTIPPTAKSGTYYLYAITPSGYTSVRINVSGASILGATVRDDLQLIETETPTPTPEIVGTPMASPTVEVPEEVVGTPGVLPDEEPIGTPAAESTEEPVGTPSADPTEEPGEIPEGTPTSDPTEEPVDEIPEGTPPVEDTDGSNGGNESSPDDGANEDDPEPIDDSGGEILPEVPTEVPAPSSHPETIIVTDQHGAPIQDVCIEATSLVTGEVVKSCDVTTWDTDSPIRDELRDGRVLMLPGVVTGEYRIELKNLSSDVITPNPEVRFLDGSDGIDIRIVVERTPPPPPEATEAPVVEEPEPVITEEEEPAPPEESGTDPGDGPDPEETEEPAA